VTLAAGSWGLPSADARLDRPTAPAVPRIQQVTFTLPTGVLSSASTTLRMIAGFTPGPGERHLSWHGFSLLRDISDDGSMVLFDEAG
jgi:hypothetical protein